ncbi:MAG: hypothetical protein ABJA79_05130 [Parafilimonas sp.]
MKYCLLLCCLFALQCCQPSSEKKIGHEIAEANGIDNFKNVQMLEFIFNVQRDTASPSSRHWQWFPKTNEVVFLTDNSSTRFKRDDTTTQDLKNLNALFTNDEYWLLYPFHLVWDNGFEMLESSMKPAPISGKNLLKITTKYNNKDGYTPGDMYDVYVDGNKRIEEWAYHEGGAAEPAIMTTWEDYKDFSGFQIAREHNSKDGKFHLWFTNIRIKNN